MQAKVVPPVCLILAVLIIVGGLLDRPSEVCLRGNKVYVSNIDLPMKGNEYDRPHTISLIKLK